MMRTPLDAKWRLSYKEGMQKPKDYLAFTIRLPLDLHARIKAASDKAGQKMIVWFTRAALEKLELEQQPRQPSGEKTHGN